MYGEGKPVKQEVGKAAVKGGKDKAKKGKMRKFLS